VNNIFCEKTFSQTNTKKNVHCVLPYLTNEYDLFKPYHVTQKFYFIMDVTLAYMKKANKSSRMNIKINYSATKRSKNVEIILIIVGGT
jgi:hypothetical protein